MTSPTITITQTLAQVTVADHDDTPVVIQGNGIAVGVISPVGIQGPPGVDGSGGGGAGVSIVATGGTSTAYTATMGLTAGYTDRAIVFVPHVTNGVSPTFNPDGLGAVPIRLSDGATAVPAGSLPAGAPVMALLSTTKLILIGTF